MSTALYIETEAREFVHAVRESDRHESAKELADVLMMCLFATLVFTEHSGESWDEVATFACQKLKRRYPAIFGNADRQLRLFYDPIEVQASREESLWQDGKRKESFLEFCFCPNPQCDAFQELGAPCLRLSGPKNKLVECTLCHKSHLLSQSRLFYRIRANPHQVLMGIAHYVKTKDIKESAHVAGTSIVTLKHWIEKSSQFVSLLANILYRRFGIDEHQTCTSLPNQRIPR
jgi:NTP pyrophosphatase (non-canonical NTP hydrolase)